MQSIINDHAFFELGFVFCAEKKEEFDPPTRGFELYCHLQENICIRQYKHAAGDKYDICIGEKVVYNHGRISNPTFLKELIQNLSE